MISTAQNTFYGNPEAVAPVSEKPAETAPRRLTPAERDTLLAAINDWQAAGCHVHPARCNGSKTPVCLEGAGTDIEPDLIPMTWPNGKPRADGGQANPRAGQWGYGYQRIRDGLMPRLTVDEMAAIIRQGRADGIGIFCGAGSGGLEMVEVEGRARGLLVKVRDAADRLGVRHLLDRLSHGCVSESGSLGLHFPLRVSDGPAAGSQPLARRPDPDSPNGVKVLAETRGQGGWFVAAPSAGRTHKSGRAYRIVRGGPATIPTFTAAERDLIYQCFRAIDEMPQQQVDAKPSRPARQRRDGEPLTPAEDFNQRATWDGILVPKGWTKYGQQKQRALEGGGTDPVQEWSKPNRPGAKHAVTTGSTLCCWSTSASLPPFKQPTERGSKGENILSKFAVYAYLNHLKDDGKPDWQAATVALRDQGYGEDDELDGVRPVVLEQMTTHDEPRTLEDWQAEVAAVRAMSVERIGFNLDRSPTGSGKTYATIQMLKTVPTSVTALPAHTNVLERVQEMKAAGIDAVAYPQLSPETCQNYPEASRAQSFGLIAGAAVCPGCPFNKNKTCHQADQYLGLMKAAHKADHRVCTHERLRLSAEKVIDKAAVGVVDELPEPVVAPEITAHIDDLRLVDNLAREVLERWDAGAPSEDEAAFARALRATFAAMTTAAAAAGGACVVDIDVPVYHEDPRTWQQMMYRWIRRLGVADLTSEGQKRFQEAMQLLTRATTGGLRSLQLLVEQTSRHEKQEDGTVIKSHPLHHFIRGSWLTPLAGKPIFLLDATGDADDLRAVLGQDVDDLTPAGHLPYQQPVRQVVVDVTKGQQAETVAGIIEDFLTTHPNVRRLGVIGHQKQVREAIGDDKRPGLLPPDLRRRIHKWTYFGAGDDRASNGWHGEGNCDHLLVIGTPRRRGAVVRAWLAHHGLLEAANLPGGDWGPRHWEAVTVDGRKVTSEGKGYRNPDWHRAATAITRADLQQAIGRARAILSDGIPVTVFSDEPTGLPVDDQPDIVTSVIRETVQVVQRAVGSRPLVCAIRPTSILVDGVAQTEGRIRTGRAVHALRETLGIGLRAAQIRLADAVKAGRLGKPERGWLSVVLDVVQAPDEPQQAVISQDVPADPPQVVRAPQGPGVVVTATGPQETVAPVDVVAAGTLETTTNVCTMTAPTGAALTVDLPDDEPAGRTDVVGIDTTALVVRSERFVSDVLQRVPGVVRTISPQDDPFSRGWGRPQAKVEPGRCRWCRSDRWVDVPIHEGQSSRRDCARCNKYGGHTVWYGKPVPWPPTKMKPKVVQPTTTTGVSFLEPAHGVALVPSC
jgi:hypothetical protein